jgi:uncharacterized protein (TIGR00661 family)
VLRGCSARFSLALCAALIVFSRGPGELFAAEGLAVRIAYGVFGYGRGHATRAAAVLPELCRRHDVRIFAGGDAYDQLAPDYAITRIPTLGYVYGRQGRMSAWGTLRRNGWHLLELLLGGPEFQAVRDAIADFRPDVVISDAEPWTHGVARRLRIPRIGFDHFGIMVYCKPRIPLGDRILSRRDVLVYRWLMGRPERIIVSSFYHARPRWPRVRVIGPLLRDEILSAVATRGEHLLAYFNKGEHLFTAQVEAALRGAGLPVLVYGTPRRGRDGNLDFRPLSNVPFVEHLASCRAVVSTAGNQLVGEAVHLGKPLLVLPEASVEQRLNAAALERRGFGMQVRHADFTPAVIAAFLGREAAYLENMRRAARNGRQDAIETLEQFIAELTRDMPARPIAAGKS